MSALVSGAQLFSRPKDGEDSYTYQGRAFVRVTSVLGMRGSEHLYAWYGTQAAKAAALPLAQVGLTDDEELRELVQSRPQELISQETAIRRACDWRRNAVEAMRYRDHKGRIGSLMHHYAYARALGEDVGARLEWLTARAMAPGVFPEDVIGRYAELGKSRQDLAQHLAFSAEPYCRSYERWLDMFQPEFEGVGLEAFVASESEEYAGTCDAWATFKRPVWEKHGPWEWKADEVCLVTDYKTSKSLSQDVICQLAAYAHADGIVHEPSGQVYPLPEWHGVLALHLQDSGSPAKTRVWSNPDDITNAFENGFLPMLERWRWEQNRPQPVKSRRARRQAAPKPDRTTVRECPF
jgi:hypothetical protein